MITFIIALGILILGYFIYGGFINRMFGADPKRVTPAISNNDGIDYVPMPTWKIFMIQFLNIAGLGPIFGAIMGAKFGMSSYLWIVFGTVFAGAVHDYLSGMISLRDGGISLPMIIGKYLGTKVEKVMTVFTMLLMLLVGAVFISQPADLLEKLTPDFFNVYFWIIMIFVYYFIASIFPIDKIIGKIYPVFAAALLFMALGILIMLFVKWPALPEVWDGLGNTYESNPIFPMMFISIACGAISGFHATQSPLMARCIKNEKYGRPVFYGAMVAEGIVALIWAAAATCYFGENGVGNSASVVVMDISKDWLGYFGGILAVLGVIAAPITSGDTALRSARLILADFFHMEQKSVKNRLLLCVPIMLVVTGILIFSIVSQDGFNIIWRYFSWLNQVLSVFTLWAITVYLVRNNKNYFVTMIPALFMTCVTMTYICIAPEGFHLNPVLSYIIAGVITIGMMVLFAVKIKRIKSDVLS
ncbi:MAG TPA: carbon starvation protein A [Bacteroidetes bacterium]|nr:carbon starvation protein A [Candidatus Limimorpha avicola]